MLLVWEEITKAKWIKAIFICLKGDFLSSCKKLIFTEGYNLELYPGMFFLCSPSFKAMQLECSPGTSSISTTWELARNAKSQTPPRSAESESTFLQNPQVIHMHIKVWEDRSITYLEATGFYGNVVSLYTLVPKSQGHSRMSQILHTMRV